MPRQIPPLLVYANPWKGQLDHNHRANTAVPWDPKDNPGRVFVGAQHRLDEDGELYFEFSQYEGTHAVAIAALSKDLTPEARVEALAKIAAEPDDLVLRKDHAPVRLPNTTYFLQALRNHSLLPADLATHVTAFGHEAHFRPIAERAASLSAERFEAHHALTFEAADPKPRPAVGAGRVGLPTGHRPVSAVVAMSPEAAKAAKDAAGAKLRRAAMNATLAKTMKALREQPATGAQPAVIEKPTTTQLSQTASTGAK
jgi:hypothetical protein